MSEPQSNRPSLISHILKQPQKTYGLKVGIVGCGFVSQFHVLAWKHLGCEITALCDINPESLKRAQATYTSAAGFLDYHEMLEKANLDAISICTVPFNHAEITAAALKQNCLVAVEKPFVCHAPEAEQFRKSNRIVLVHNQMFESHYYEALRLIGSGKLGRIYEASVLLGDPVTERMTADLKGWAYKLLGGRIAETLPHPIYELQFLLGDDNLRVRDVDAATFSDRPTYRALTAVLENFDGSRRGTLNVRFLNGLFGNFWEFLIGGGILISLYCIAFGYFWMKRSKSYKEQINVDIESNPYQTSKLTPNWTPIIEKFVMVFEKNGIECDDVKELLRNSGSKKYLLEEKN